MISSRATTKEINFKKNTVKNVIKKFKWYIRNLNAILENIHSVLSKERSKGRRVIQKIWDIDKTKSKMAYVNLTISIALSVNG